MRKKRKALDIEANYLRFNSKRVDLEKILALILTIDEALINAFRNLIEDEKVIKTELEKSTIRKLIDQIDQTRVELDLTKVNENQSNLIDQVY
jgi:hypothetical protein